MKALFGIVLAALLASAPTLGYDGPVIDMHLHAWPSGEDGGPDKPKNQAAMRKKLAELEKHNIVLAMASGPQEFLAVWGEAEPDRLVLGPIFPCIDGKNPTSYRHECFTSGENFPDIEWLRKQYESGALGVMGELYNQYAGIPFDDPRMDPYYAMAQELGIPVAFHVHSAPPLTAQQCCPEFRISNGNPLLVENVLVKYPKLKAQIMHANPLIYPEVLVLLRQYPKVYVDISPWQMAYTRPQFHSLLKAYDDAGLLSRIMFGSDSHDYAKAFEAYESAEFLNDRELKGIFCENAARFMRRRDLCE